MQTNFESIFLSILTNNVQYSTSLFAKLIWEILSICKNHSRQQQKVDYDVKANLSKVHPCTQSEF